VLLQGCYSTCVCRPMSSKHNGVKVLLPCCYSVVTVELQYLRLQTDVQHTLKQTMCYSVVTMVVVTVLLLCFYSVVTGPVSADRCPANTMVLKCCYRVVTVLLQCCYRTCVCRPMSSTHARSMASPGSVSRVSRVSRVSIF
jgi:multisubunit Na+/H+ antiporter MnhF subunit